MVSQDDSPESLSLRESSPSPGMDSEAPNPIPSKPKGKKDESKKSVSKDARSADPSTPSSSPFLS
jgi:hypothetical protein